MPTAQRLALEAALQAAWRRLHAAELLADEADEEGIREDLAQMKYHLLVVQEQMLKRGPRSRRERSHPRELGIIPPLPGQEELPF